jgi:PEP-CTERM motif
MKSRLLLCTLLLALFAVPAFADSVTFTNRGGVSISSTGISANSMIDSLGLNGTTILWGNIGSLQFDTGIFTGSLQSGGSFTGGEFAFGVAGSSAVIFANNFTGTLTKIGKDLYDLVGTFSGTFDGVHFSGYTNQVLGFGDDDHGRRCFSDLHGTTTITTSAVPEPGTLMLFGTGLMAMAGAVRRKLATGRSA